LRRSELGLGIAYTPQIVRKIPGSLKRSTPLCLLFNRFQRQLANLGILHYNHCVTQTAPPSFSPPPFLDVNRLLESSRPVQRFNWISYAACTFLVVTVIGLFQGSQSSPFFKMLQLSMSVMVLPTLIAAAVMSVANVRRFRAQARTLEAIEEMMQLRRWEPAGMLLDRFLSMPVRTGGLWAQALVDLASLLSRHHRFEDAISVQTFVIDNELLDDQSDFLVRLSRAMAMLREDHLVDADRAISDLRRRDPDRQSGGLALLEIFRDVKTGHPDEAISLFAKHLSQMQQQLGHRVADAHALVARAYDLLGKDSEARAAYERATLMAPISEIQRRYPELVKLAEKYPPAIAPPEIIGSEINRSEINRGEMSRDEMSRGNMTGGNILSAHPSGGAA
jgi:tetratricopeptide (TPR) repeat protein